MRPKLMDWEGERVPKISENWTLACIKKSLKNRWFWRSKIEENLEKNGSKDFIFFAYVFESILERFGAGFGRVLGGVRELLGVSWGTFKLLFLRLCCQEGPRGSKRRPRGLLGSIWDGFGEVLRLK